MTEEDFNRYWIHEDGTVWRLVMYCDSPTATFARVDDPNIKLGGAIGSPIIRQLRRLVPEDAA